MCDNTKGHAGAAIFAQGQGCFLSTCFGVSSKYKWQRGLAEHKHDDLQSARIRIARDISGVRIHSKDFWTTQVLRIRKKFHGNDKWKLCMSTIEFLHRVRIKSYVLKLSTEQHVRARNFGQTCRNARCQVVRSRRAPEILTKITVREARASYNQNERNRWNVETNL